MNCTSRASLLLISSDVNFQSWNLYDFQSCIYSCFFLARDTGSARWFPSGLLRKIIWLARPCLDARGKGLGWCLGDPAAWQRILKISESDFLLSWHMHLAHWRRHTRCSCARQRYSHLFSTQQVFRDKMAWLTINYAFSHHCLNRQVLKNK